MHGRSRRRVSIRRRTPSSVPRALLDGARRPLAIVGGLPWSAEANVALTAWCEASGVPLAVGWRRQDMVDNTSSAFAGHLTLGADPRLTQRVRDADVLLVIGDRLSEITTAGYTLLRVPNPEQALLHVSPDPNELGRVYAPTLAIPASPDAFALALSALPALDGTARQAEVRQARDDYLDNLRHLPVPGALNMGDVMALLRERLPADAILTNGAGNFSVWTHRFYEFRQYPTQLAPTSGAMGYGVPAAVAAKLLHPERIVVAMAGDGDFLMTGQELATAVQYEAAIVVLVVNNGMYGTIRMHQERHYPGPRLRHGPRQPRLRRARARLRRARRRGRADGGLRGRLRRGGVRRAARRDRAAGRRRGADAEAVALGDPRAGARSAGVGGGGRPCVVSTACPGRPSRSRTSRTPSRRTASCSSPASCPVDERRELVGGEDVVLQARCVFENMRAVLAAAGCTFADVVKVTVFLTDVNDRALINPVRQEVFGETRPASTLVEVSALVIPGARIEVECVAVIRRETRPASTPRITWLDEPLRGAAEGPLAGRTLLVKDLIDTAGVRTTYGSRIYGDHVPDAHAEVVRRVLAAGALVVGKANLPEFAWSVLGANPWYGTVHNPAHPGKTTGGSSSGNAAALAAGLVDLGIGSDTGCSIRLPSAACGTVGLKSQWGLIPLDGIFPLVPSLDTVGPMARTVEDVTLLWSVLSGRPAPEPRLEGADGRPPPESAVPGGRARDRVERRGGGLGAGARAARGARGRGVDPGRSRRHVAALPARGGAEPPRDVPVPRRRVRRR